MATSLYLEPRRRMVELAERNGGALTRAEARACGVGPHAVSSEQRAGRIRVQGRSIRIVGAPVARTATMLCVLANSSPRAALDGLTALEVAGLEGFADDFVHLGMPKGARSWRSKLVVRHELRSWDGTDVVDNGVLRIVRPARAALCAALWLPTPRAAATVLAMVVQQDLVGIGQLLEAATVLPRRQRTKEIRAILDEIAGGCESINEIDLAAGCRRRGLPEPSRQGKIRTPSGRWIHDADWDQYGVRVEVNGVQHMRPDQSYRDDLKHNESAIGHTCLLRASSFAVRNDDDAIYEQIARALRSRGWRG